MTNAKQRPTPDDMVATSPIPCAFAVGQRVIFTNENGVEFQATVRGFTAEVLSGVEDPRFVYLDTSCWWFPKSASSLRAVELKEGQGTW